MAKAFRNSLAATPGGITMGNLASNGKIIPITTALNMLQSASSFRINDPAFMRTMHSYVENCVVPDIISGYMDIYTVGTSPDFWAELGKAQHGIRFGSNFMHPDAKNIGFIHLYALTDPCYRLLPVSDFPCSQLPICAYIIRCLL